MPATATAGERLYEAALAQGQTRHAVKAALAACLATVVAYYYHVPSGQFAPLFAVLLLTLGMPSPDLNWLLAQAGIVASAVVSGVILWAFRDAHGLYLAATLLWVFLCLTLASRYALGATLGAMVSALGVFVYFQGTVGAALEFYAAYAASWCS